MKNLFVFLCLFIGLHSFAQSKKKINAELKQDLILRQREYDSIKTIYDSLYANWMKLSDFGYEAKVNEIKDYERRLKLRQRDIALNQKKLTKLGEKYEEPEKIPLMDLKAIQKSYNNTLSYVPHFDYVDDINLFDLSVKEQNEELRLMISQFDGVYQNNSKTIDSIDFHSARKNEWLLTLDSALVQLIVSDYILLKNDEQLNSQLKVLKENYIAKGRKGFSAAYEEIFPKNEPNTITHAGVEYSEPTETPKFKENVEAQFPGGLGALDLYLENHLAIPEQITRGRISGKVFVKFKVSKTGTISDVKIQSTDKGFICPECEKEAVRVVKTMPDWIPAISKGEDVDSYYTLPILFGAGK